MKITFLTDSYMKSPEHGLVLDPFRRGVVDVLRRLGHEVVPIIVNQAHLYDRSLTPQHPDGRARLAADIAAHRPDLLLSINRAGLCPEVLELRGPRVASWYIDNVHGFAPELLEFAAHERVFFFGPRSVTELEGAPARLPLERRFYLPLGVDPRAFQPMPEVASRTSTRFNILFLGGYFPSSALWRVAGSKSPAFYQRLRRLYEAMPSISSWPVFEAKLIELELPETTEAERRGLLNALLASWTGLERIRRLEAIREYGLTLYGGGWEQLIPEHLELLESYAGCSLDDPRLLSQLFSLSRMTVNVTHLQSRLCGGLNLRVFEALSTGTLLVSDHPEEVGTMFEEGVEFLGYRSVEELREKCGWALAHPEDAARIAAAGRRAVLNGHTLPHRLATLLQVMEEG